MSIDAAGARPPQDVRGGVAARGSAEHKGGALALGEIREDCRALGGGVPAEAMARRRHFGDAAALEAHHFEPGLTYTFNNYQHYFGPHDYCLDLVLARWDITRFLGDAAT